MGERDQVVVSQKSNLTRKIRVVENDVVQDTL